MSDDVSKEKPVPSNSEGQGQAGRHGTPPRSTYTPADPEHVDIFKLLDQLEEIPERARHLPMNTLVGFNHEQFYLLVLKIRANLPEDLKKAHVVVTNTTQILQDAERKADKEVESSKAESDRIISAAQSQAQSILAAAEAGAERAREQAQRSAAAMIAAAEAESARLVSGEEVTRVAEVQAREMLRNAETEAGETRQGADQYAMEVLAKIEAYLGRAMQSVRDGREELEGGSGSASR